MQQVENIHLSTFCVLRLIYVSFLFPEYFMVPLQKNTVFVWCRSVYYYVKAPPELWYKVISWAFRITIRAADLFLMYVFPYWASYLSTSQWENVICTMKLQGFQLCVQWEYVEVRTVRRTWPARARVVRSIRSKLPSYAAPLGRRRVDASQSRYFALRSKKTAIEWLDLEWYVKNTQDSFQTSPWSMFCL